MVLNGAAPWIQVVLAAAWGYLLGSVPTGVLICRVLGAPDPRRSGSGHTGGLNVARQGGFWAGAATGAVDALLGAGAVAGAVWLTGNAWAGSAAGVLAVAGHNWSVYIRFAGGIGLSTLFGALFITAPLAALVGLGLLALFWLILSRLLRVHRARATVLTMVAAGPLLWGLGLSWPAVLLGALGGVVIILKTLPDWRRSYD